MANLDAGKLFNVKGMSFVVTGGGSGMQPIPFLTLATLY